MNQLTLPYPLARDKDVMTSHEAADKMIESGEINRQEEFIYSAIIRWTRHCETFTTKDIATCISWCTYDKAYDICRKRFSGLRNKGKIERTGKKRDGCYVERLK